MHQTLSKAIHLSINMITRGAAVLLALGLALSIYIPTTHAAPKVAASIRPVHSLVAFIMQGAGEPILIQTGITSPHDYALKPSQARYINEADLIFWIGPEIESYLERATNSIANKSASIELGKEARANIEHEEKKHDDEHADENRQEHTKEHSEDHKDEHGHHHEHADLHIWLDPVQASAMAEKIANALSNIDPQNAEHYQENYKLLSSRLSILTDGIEGMVQPFAQKHFIVYHDAYGHFQKRFGLENVQPLTIKADIAPGAATIRKTQDLITQFGIKCAFAEPQFSANRIAILAADYNLTIKTLDPIGVDIVPGPDLYFQLLNSLANNMKSCLSHQ